MPYPKCTCDETGPEKCPLYNFKMESNPHYEIGKGRDFETVADLEKAVQCLDQAEEKRK